MFPSFKLLNESFHISGDFSVCPSFLRKSCLVLGVTMACVRDHGNTYSNLKSRERERKSLQLLFVAVQLAVRIETRLQPETSAQENLVWG